MKPQTLLQSTHHGIEERKSQKNKFNATHYVRPGLTEAEIQEIKMAFDLFDIDGEKIDHNDLKKAMTTLGFRTKNETIYQMINGLDIDGGCMIEFEEFLQLMTARNNDRKSIKAIQNVYNLFAPKRQGYITLKDLRK